VALAVSTFLIGREQARTEVARAEAVRQRQQAEAQRQRTERSYQKGRLAADQMLTRLMGLPLAGLPQMELVRAALLKEALAFYRELLQEESHEPEVQRERAVAWLRIG